MTRLVVVGHGMVGSRFVEDLLAADRAERYRVTVLGAEDCAPYNRVLLSDVIAGTTAMHALTLPVARHERVTVRQGVAATAIDREDRAVVAADGTRHRYDQLVLATGAAARIPGLDGIRVGNELLRGVHALRTVDDARGILGMALDAGEAVVLGAGVLGLETAVGLARRGLRVTVVHPARGLMERQLDETAGSVLARAMGLLGVDHRVGQSAVGAVAHDGALTGVRLASGEVLPASLLVLTVGTVPNTALAGAAGLPTDRGVLVTATLASPADHRVFAIGDCAQPPEGSAGLVAEGWDQSRRLAARLGAAAGAGAGTGPGRATSVGSSATPGHPARRRSPDEPAPAPPTTDVVRLKGHGLDVVTMGICGSRRTPDPDHRTVRLSDPDAGRHVEVVVDGTRLVGATCVGAGQVAADLVAAYTRRTPVPVDPAYLLLPALLPSITAATADPCELPDEATVCRCNGVPAGAIRTAARDGAADVAAVGRATRAGTGCGGCADDVRALLGQAREISRRDNPGVTEGKHVHDTCETKAG